MILDRIKISNAGIPRKLRISSFAILVSLQILDSNVYLLTTNNGLDKATPIFYFCMPARSVKIFGIYLGRALLGVSCSCIDSISTLKSLIQHCDIHSWFKLEKSHEDTPLSFAANKTWPIFSTAL